MINFDKIPSPCFVLDENLLLKNLAIIDKVREEAGVEIIVALKACAMWRIFPTLAEHSDGATASSLAEAKLVLEEYGKRAHTYAPVYSDKEFDDIMRCSDYITFNSLSQYERFGPRAMLNGISCGLRINPEFSTVDTPLYDPSSSTSRLGMTSDKFPYLYLPAGIEGLHFHTLCEGSPTDLLCTLDTLETRFGHLFKHIKWLNMGGGHLMTSDDYDVDYLITILKDFKAKYPWLRIILEPGSAFTWNTGYLVSTVEDIVSSGGVNTLMLDVSFACHMPDTLEMPYKPRVLGARDPKKIREKQPTWRLGGNSCLAGDFKGDYVFEEEPVVGSHVVFEDMMHYTMVKTTMFNGVSHPAIAVWTTEDKLKVVKRFKYEDYKKRMC